MGTKKYSNHNHHSIAWHRRAEPCRNENRVLTRYHCVVHNPCQHTIRAYYWKTQESSFVTGAAPAQRFRKPNSMSQRKKDGTAVEVHVGDDVWEEGSRGWCASLTTLMVHSLPLKEQNRGPPSQDWTTNDIFLNFLHDTTAVRVRKMTLAEKNKKLQEIIKSENGVDIYNIYIYMYFFFSLLCDEPLLIGAQNRIHMMTTFTHSTEQKKRSEQGSWWTFAWWLQSLMTNNVLMFRQNQGKKYYRHERWKRNNTNTKK